MARLEDKELVFRGEVRVRAPLDLVTDVRARGGVLSLRYGGEDLSLRLGELAERWADRILHPPSRLDKLGVKEGQRVSVIDLEDPAFLKELEARGATVVGSGAKADMVFLACRSVGDLEALASLMRAIPPEGAIWVLWAKGGQALREGDVREAALPLGLVDVKVVAFSDVLSGLKLMIRREQRPANVAARAAAQPAAARRRKQA
ncbi:MAG TPA: hypothetical protein VFO85_19770 [Vicinamibacteria bacterium]|nr:hypothetical protein [Vicinamibacteria bacterium]